MSRFSAIALSSLFGPLPLSRRLRRGSFSSGSLPGRLLVDGVVEAYDPVGVRAGGAQRQRDRAMPRMNERNAFPDEGGNHMDNELVDLPFIEKRSGELGSADQPDVLPLGVAQPPREVADRLAHELDVRGVAPAAGSREDVIPLAGISLLPELERDVV